MNENSTMVELYYYELCVIQYIVYLKKFFLQYSYSIYGSCQVKIFLELMKIAVTKACRFNSIVRQNSPIKLPSLIINLLETNCNISIDDTLTLSIVIICRILGIYIASKTLTKKLFVWTLILNARKMSNAFYYYATIKYYMIYCMIWSEILYDFYSII